MKHMRQWLAWGMVTAVLGGAALLAGCGGSATGGAGGEPSAATTARPSGMSADEQMDVSAPREAQYTLFCRAFTTPNHAAVAEQVKAQVEELTRLRDFYLVRGEERTVLYHGFYQTFDDAVDPREAARAQADRDLLDTLVDSMGQRIFPQAIFQSLDTADPEAPPEWDLRNAQGYWTVLISTYTESVQRKQAAVESVRAAREQGIEAYFLHVGGQSHVCIGSWPKEAVKAQEGMRGGNSEQGIDPNDPPTLIVGMSELDPAFKNLRDHRGRRPRILEMKVEPLDPTLKKALADYEYSVNGFVKEGQPKPAPLLEIARATGRKQELENPEVEEKRDLKPLLQRAF